MELFYILICLFPLLGFIGSGSGTSGDPYIVTDMDELNDVRNDLTAFYEQANDIDAGAETDNSGGTYWNGGAGWTPIASSGTNFTGEYDFNGFSIDGLFQNDSDADGLGLFQRGGSGTFLSVSLTNCNITNSGGRAGGLASNLSNGTVTIAETSGTVDGTQNVGGVVGQCINATSITQATNSATVTTSSTSSTEGAGGIAGRISGTTVVEDCQNSGDIHTQEVGGGIAGYMGGSAVTNRCESHGGVIDDGTTASYIGGVVGRDNFGGGGSDCFWDTEVTNAPGSSDVGTGKTTAQMQDVATYTDTTTTGLTNPWDFVGNPNDDAANNDYWDIDTGYPFLTAFTTTTTTTLVFSQGSYSITGQDYNLVTVDVLGFNQGSYSVTGQDIGLVEVQVLSFEQGTYTITGSTAELLETDILEFGQGAYAITGQDIGLVSIDVLDFQQGSYAITGNDIGLITSTMTTMTFGQGSYSITGQDIGLKQVDVLSFGQGNYAISGQDIGLKKVDVLSFDQGSYNISGQPIGFVEIKVLDFEQGTYSITGQDFRIVISSPEVLTLDSTIATFIELDSEIMTQLNLDSKI